MFKVNAKLTQDLIDEFDSDDTIFYRFQNPNYAIEGDYTSSWGMIYESSEEARRSASEFNWDEEDAVLPGKSCMNTFENLMVGCWINQYDLETDVLLVFKGWNTGHTGHDGEFVAEYIEPVAVFSLKDACSFYEAYLNQTWEVMNGSAEPLTVHDKWLDYIPREGICKLELFDLFHPKGEGLKVTYSNGDVALYRRLFGCWSPLDTEGINVAKEMSNELLIKTMDVKPVMEVSSIEV